MLGRPTHRLKLYIISGLHDVNLQLHLLRRLAVSMCSWWPMFQRPSLSASSEVIRRDLCCKETENERRESGRGVVRDTTFWGRARKQFFSPVLKVSRHFTLILLVQIRMRDGKVLGREMVKFFDAEFVMSRGQKMSRGFTVCDQN